VFINWANKDAWLAGTSHGQHFVGLRKLEPYENIILASIGIVNRDLNAFGDSI